SRDSSNKVADEEQPDPKKAQRWALKFEWIDFTELDHGLIGHSIPFDLIANLWAKSEPGEGLKMEETEVYKPNKLSRLFTGIFHEKSHLSENLGIYKRVVISKPLSEAEKTQSSNEDSVASRKNEVK
ncbi:MAG: hypothetical protein K2X27_16610, partial [Candidatus Obscuribacterales bacterium]|nr:hypothetical protein [Candidatus Obscuribacterales bacterium]